MEPKKNIKKFGGFEIDTKPTTNTDPNLMYEPITIHNNRFIMELPTPGGITECFVNCERPNLMDRDHGFDDEFWSIQPHMWEPIRVNIRDVIGDNQQRVGEFLMEWFQEFHSVRPPGTYKKDVVIRVVDPTGVVVESWYIQGSFITTFTVSPMDYNINEIEMEFTLSYDNCMFCNK